MLDRSDLLALEGLLGREGHGVQQQIQTSELLLHRGEHRANLVIAAHIAGEDERVGSEGAGQFLHVVFESLTLVGERERCALAVPRLSNGPGDGALVGDAEHDAEFAFEKSHKETSVWENPGPGARLARGLSEPQDRASCR